MTSRTRNLAGGVEPEGLGGPENTGNFGVGWTEIWPSSNGNSKIANDTILYTEMYPSG